VTRRNTCRVVEWPGRRESGGHGRLHMGVTAEAPRVDGFGKRESRGRYERDRGGSGRFTRMVRRKLFRVDGFGKRESRGRYEREKG
jgi:hypothetical protein